MTARTSMNATGSMRAAGSARAAGSLSATLVGLGTATPAHELLQADAREFAAGFFSGQIKGLQRLLPAFEHTEIERRQLARPLAWYGEPHAFADKNAVYCSCARDLARRASTAALHDARMTARDIGAVVFVSSTGLSTPSLDVSLIADLNGRPGTARVPIWGLGCAGGTAGLVRAAELAYARQQPVLLVAVEVCSATFMHNDRSRANLIATALFGDGAAAAVLVPQATHGIEVLGGASQLLDDSQDVMGWTLDADGLRVRFARSIPSIVRDVVPQMRETAACAVGRPSTDFEHYVLHPGGAKVLSAYADALEVDPNALQTARAVLRAHGNMSSPTVLFVLEQWRRQQAAKPHQAQPQAGLGLMLALGPGFCAEAAVLRWRTDA